MLPKFIPGQIVKHLGGHVGKLNRKARVVECINEHDMEDVLGFTDNDGDFHPGQGFRYYVTHDGFTWSVPEHYLSAK